MSKELDKELVVKLIKKIHTPTMKRSRLLFEVMFSLVFHHGWSWGEVYSKKNEIEDIIREVIL